MNGSKGDVMPKVRESRRYGALLVVSIAGLVLSRWIAVIGA